MQSNDEEFLWSEKYRPRTIRDCILPKELSDTFLAFIEKGEIPNMLLNGSAGVGKTSVARALCEELGWDYILINSGESSGIDKVRTDMRQFASSMSLQGKPKAIILDEADRITIAAQSALHGFVEEFSQNCRLILTSNHKNKIFPPLHSRTTVIDFHLRNEDQPKMAAKFMKRVKEILKQEKIEYDDRIVATVISTFFPDYRKILVELQRYAATGKIDEGILSNLSRLDLSSLFGSLKEKNFRNMWQWVENNTEHDYQTIFVQLGDELMEAVTPETGPPLVIILAEYGYRSAFAADASINLAACLTEVMLKCQFK